MRNFDTLKFAIVSSAVIAVIVVLCAIIYFVFLNPGSDFKIQQFEKKLVVADIDKKVSETITTYGEGVRNPVKHDNTITITTVKYDNQKIFNYDVTKTYVYSEPVIVLDNVVENPDVTDGNTPDNTNNVPDNGQQTVEDTIKLSDEILNEVKDKETNISVEAIVYEVKNKDTVSVNDLFEKMKSEFGIPNHIEMREDGKDIFTADWTVNGKTYTLINDNTVLSVTVTNEV